MSVCAQEASLHILRALAGPDWRGDGPVFQSPLSPYIGCSNQTENQGTDYLRRYRQALQTILLQIIPTGFVFFSF